MFIITGGGSGLGRALAVALTQRMHTVLIVGRRETLLKETASLSPLISYLCTDISTPTGRDILIQHVRDVEQIHALINNAGILDPIASLQDISVSAWQQAFHTNVEAALFLPQQLYRQLHYGRVLNIGSGAAYFPISGWAAYCVSKAALAMLTQCWQLEAKEVVFTSVMPGIVDTDMQAIARQGINMDAEHTQFYRQLKNTQRLLSPETVAQFLVWLLLDIDKELYQAKEWDIYDSSHHQAWLKPPHQVPHWEA